MVPGPSDLAKLTDPTPKEQAAALVTDAEKSRARMLGVSGMPLLINQGVTETKAINVVAMDEDYQMIDAHLDETIKCKIVNYEYVDFSKLIAKK